MISEAYFVTVVIILGWSIIELINGFIVNRTRRPYQQVISNERIRTHFAMARRRLMKLAMNGEIDINSYTFKALYNTHTFILRRPDHYTEISKALTVVLLSNKENGDLAMLLEQEAPGWSAEVRKLVKNTGKGLFLIVLEYSWVLKLVKWLENHFRILTALLKGITALTSLANALKKWLLEVEARTNPELTQIRETGENLTHLTAHNAA